jgi:hypothetical protein
MQEEEEGEEDRRRIYIQMDVPGKGGKGPPRLV